MEKVIEVKKLSLKNNRKAVHLLVNGNFILGSNVDEGLINVNIFNILLDSISVGFEVIVTDQWDN